MGRRVGAHRLCAVAFGVGCREDAVAQSVEASSYGKSNSFASALYYIVVY